MSETNAAVRILSSEQDHTPIEARYARVLREEEEMGEQLQKYYRCTWLELIVEPPR